MPPLELAARMLYWFFVYGLLGWCLEVMFAAVKERRLVNRGFLCGPICPIYGFGMVALLLAVRALGDPGGLAGAAVTFVTGMVLATLVELVAGWVLFQLYHIRWWDYSHLKGNIGGYICPQFSLLWGLGSVVMVHAVHPLLAGPGNALPLRALLVLDAVLLVFFAVDVGVSAAAAAGLNKRLKELDTFRTWMRRSSDTLTEVLGTGAMTADTLLDEQKLQLALAKLEGRDNAAELRAELRDRADQLRSRLDALELDKRGVRRLLRAFPRMQSAAYSETLDATRAALRKLQQLARTAQANAREAADSAADWLHDQL